MAWYECQHAFNAQARLVGRRTEEGEEIDQDGDFEFDRAGGMVDSLSHIIAQNEGVPKYIPQVLSKYGTASLATTFPEGINRI